MASGHLESALQHLLHSQENDRKLYNEHLQTLNSILHKLYDDRQPTAYGPVTIHGGQVQLGDRYASDEQLNLRGLQALAATAHPHSSPPALQNTASDFLAMRLSACSIDHRAILDILTPQSAARRNLYGVSPFWLDAKFDRWNTAAASTQMFLKAPFRDRHIIRAFCVETIQQLMAQRILVLHVLSVHDQVFSLQDILLSLISQVLAFQPFHSSHPMPNSLARRLQSARSDEDYIDALAIALSESRVAFIIVNTETMLRDTAVVCRAALHSLRKKLESYASSTLLRIITTCHSPSHSVGSAILPGEDLVKTNDKLRAKPISRHVLRQSGFKRSASHLDIAAVGMRRTKRRLAQPPT